MANDISDVISAVASLAWPLLIALVLVLFRNPLKSLIDRIESAEAPGFKVTARALDALGNKVDRAAESVAGPDADALEHSDADEARQNVLSVAGESPTLALIRVAQQLERLSGQILAGSRDPEAWEGRSLEHKLRRLDLNPDLRAAALEFQHIRNKIVHGGEAAAEQVLRAVDYGLSLLDALDRIPREIHFVVQPHVSLFTDAGAQIPARDFHGVMLRSETTNGGKPRKRIFPTTRDHFREGMAVAWEWGSGGFPPAWFFDPDTQSMVKAYDRSAEFVGRPLEAIS